MVSENFHKIREKVAVICQKLGRDPDDITIIGVTKTAEADQIKEAADSGLKDIGENRVQEAQRKFPSLDQWGVKVRRHMIGHLQTNKVKQVLQYFDIIHSVDSLDLAAEIEKRSANANRVTDILVQVNTSGEEQKFGVSKDGFFKLIDEISTLSHVHIRGLMTMAPYTEDKAWVRQTFRDLKILKDAVNVKYSEHKNIEMKYLSMGMSDDFEIALEEGSNMIRVGRAIFQG